MPTAIVFINTEPKEMPCLLEKVKALKEVKEAVMVYSCYAIVAKVNIETMENLKQIITSRIRSMANVRSTVSSLVVKQAIICSSCLFLRKLK